MALEDSLTSLSRYVEFSYDNFNSYSIEMVRILLSAGSEVDVVLKDICKILEPSRKVKNISDYRDLISSKSLCFDGRLVHIPRFGLDFEPWSDWSSKEPLFWWRSYNKVKHQRSSSYSEGNLKNVLYAMAALFSANVVLCKLNGISKVCPPPSMFRSLDGAARVMGSIEGEQCLFVH
ncbi:hypothetical protein [Marinobacter salexigens]|uniref:Uncharacterized protein n=1 Tax=Marinobacter salexigens TaxID=1925763 RepID=A0ABS6ACR5_9GAMM|nr:hypothetical protein [Marinobacter salexigens]MBU2875938.1 hypothetical protein [Marinobacter salexigens]